MPWRSCLLLGFLSGVLVDRGREIYAVSVPLPCCRAKWAIVLISSCTVIADSMSSVLVPVAGRILGTDLGRPWGRSCLSLGRLPGLDNRYAILKAVHPALFEPTISRRWPIPFREGPVRRQGAALYSSSVGHPRFSRPRAGVWLEELAHGRSCRGSATVATQYGLEAHYHPSTVREDSFHAPPVLFR